MADFADIIDASLRLALLRILEDPDLNYTANSAVLHSVVGTLGFHVTRDKVHSTVDWLREQGLVRVEALGNVRVVTATQRGLDIAAGRGTVSGVDRPSPRA